MVYQQKYPQGLYLWWDDDGASIAPPAAPEAAAVPESEPEAPAPPETGIKQLVLSNDDTIP